MSVPLNHISNNALTALHQIERFSQDIISWDLDRITVLRNTLRDWVMMDIPLSKIGRYLELILYNNDEHMKGRLTEMVNSRCRHIRIALDILQYYQIRDDQQKPLWLPRGQDYGDWYSIAGVPNAAANAAAFDETRRRARIVDVNSTPPGPHPAMRDQDLFDASTTAPTSGPQLLMYHHANPSVGRVGRFIDQEGNIVLMQPHLWS